jgi:DNA repair protein RecO
MTLASSNKSSLSRPAVFDYALITSFLPYGDCDAVVRLLTKNSGRITAFSRRGLSNKKSGSVLQAPCFAEVSYVMGDEGKLHQLKTCDIEPSTYLLAGGLKVLGYSAYVAEVVEYFLPEGEAALEVFSLCQETFTELCRRGAHSVVLRAFELKLLNFCGYMPHIFEMAEETQTVVAYDPVNCVFLDELTDGAVAFNEAAVQMAHQLLSEPVALAQCNDSELLKMVGQLFLSRLRLFNRPPLKSVRFLNQLTRATS